VRTCFVRTRLLQLFASCLLPAVLSAQNADGPLQRRAWFGVALASHTGGAEVTGVAPNSPAAIDGMSAGDVIRAVDEQPVQTPADVVAAVTRHLPGTAVIIDVLRGGDHLRRSVIVRSMPIETLPRVLFQYGSVTLRDGTRLRTIMSPPTAPASAHPR
jgi:S1-C subfamily serine protease